MNRSEWHNTKEERVDGGIVPEMIQNDAGTRSHGETFFTLLDLKFRRNGLFLLDEPEAALSPQRQLSFLVLIHDVLQKYKDAQLIISTHSPIILGCRDGQIRDDARMAQVLELAKAGKSTRGISQMLDISQPTVVRILQKARQAGLIELNQKGKQAIQ